MKECLTINCGGRLVTLERPLVMGIVNLTPDSFFAGSRYCFNCCPGADIVDIGACSTRPGGEQCSEDEEIARLSEALPQILEHTEGKIVSIDTYRPAVAKYAIDAIGVDIINDISGGSDEMFEVAAAHKKAYVLTYPDGGGVAEMLLWFSKRIDTLARMGVADIILDPGIGFGKSLERNLEIVRDLAALKTMGLPVLVGVSRKSVIYKSLGIGAEEALNGTTVLNTLLLERGADILRVHDVNEAAEAVKLFELTR